MTYKLGDKGDSVRMIQVALQAAGYSVATDGVYGQQTVNAVKSFQIDSNLTFDGVAGPKTLAALFGVSISKGYINQHITRLAGRSVRYIAVHYTAGSSSRAGSAMAVRKVFMSRSASADFVVDDEQIVQINPDLSGYYCWAVGDKKNISSGGGQLYGQATNRNTVSIEVCSNLAKQTSASMPNHSGWSFSDAALSHAVRLVRYLMVMYGIPKERVVRHYDISGKLCPGIPGFNDGLLYTTSGSKTGKRNDSSKWIEFRNRI